MGPELRWFRLFWRWPGPPAMLVRPAADAWPLKASPVNMSAAKAPALWPLAAAGAAPVNLDGGQIDCSREACWQQWMVTHNEARCTAGIHPCSL